MSTIRLDIINDALNYLGSEVITSLTEDTKNARVMSRQFPIARDFILRTYGWNFAKRRAVLSVAPDKPIWGGGNLFNLPNDCVRILKVFSDNTKKLTHRVEGRRIYASANQIYLLYVSNAVEENLFDSEFKKAVSAQLAADSCYAITQSTSLMAQYYGLAKTFVEGARSTDSMEGSAEDFTFDYFDVSRSTTHEIYPDDDFFQFGPP